MVIQPVDEIGKYGGIWRRGFTGPGDNENGNRIQASDRPVLVDHTGAMPRPSLAKGWEMSEDGKTYTLYLREGLKWSDGAPMTADDFVFWYEDIYGNKDIVPTPIPDMSPQGQARADRQGRRLHRQLRVRRALLPVRGADDGRHPHRRRPGGAAVGEAQLRRLCAGPLPQAVPAEIRRRRGGGQCRRQGGRLRQLGRLPALQEGLDAQSRAAGARARSGPCSRSTTRPG